MSAIESVVPATAMPCAPQEFLAFTVGAEEYGIDIQKVGELRGYGAVTRLPSESPSMKGVLNLRGHIIPIVDMRIRFGLHDPVYDQFTVVIILTVAGRMMGMVVDSVSDVVALSAEQIKPAPEMDAALAPDSLIGLASIDERMLILVDIDKFISAGDRHARTALAA